MIYLTYDNYFAAGSVRMSLLTSKVTDHSIEKEMKDWLKFTSDGRNSTSDASTDSCWHPQTAADSHYQNLIPVAVIWNNTEYY